MNVTIVDLSESSFAVIAACELRRSSKVICTGIDTVDKFIAMLIGSYELDIVLSGNIATGTVSSTTPVDELIILFTKEKRLSFFKLRRNENVCKKLLKNKKDSVGRVHGPTNIFNKSTVFAK